MISKRSSVHGQWSSRWVFILAATGSAVGLGNILRFPYLVGENGGGAFVLVYLICVVLVGVPIMMAEILLGRRGRQSPINTMSILAAEEGLSQYWQLIGWMGVIAGFIILSYYSVIAGWTLACIFRTGAGAFILTNGFSLWYFFEVVIYVVWFNNTVLLNQMIYLISFLQIMKFHRSPCQYFYCMFLQKVNRERTYSKI